MPKPENNCSSISHKRLSGFSTPKLLGHRGARAERLENSRDGFVHIQELFKRQCNDSSLSQNIHGVEFDVQLTADKQLVVFHDDNLMRIYGLQARVEQLTFYELTKLTANSYRIMPLYELWPLLQGYHHIQLEIKTHARSNVADIVKALRQHVPFAGLPITLTSFDVDLQGYLQRCPVLSLYPRGLLRAPTKKINPILQGNKPNVRLTALTASLVDQITLLDQMTKDTVNLASSLGCTHIGLFYPLINASIVQLCKRHNLVLSAWTVNEVETVTYLTNIGVDYIITDYPTLMSTIS